MVKVRIALLNTKYFNQRAAKPSKKDHSVLKFQWDLRPTIYTFHIAWSLRTILNSHLGAEIRGIYSDLRENKESMILEFRRLFILWTEQKLLPGCPMIMQKKEKLRPSITHVWSGSTDMDGYLQTYSSCRLYYSRQNVRSWNFHWQWSAPRILPGFSILTENKKRRERSQERENMSLLVLDVSKKLRESTDVSTTCAFKSSGRSGNGILGSLKIVLGFLQNIDSLKRVYSLPCFKALQYLLAFEQDDVVSH